MHFPARRPRQETWLYKKRFSASCFPFGWRWFEYSPSHPSSGYDRRHFLAQSAHDSRVQPEMRLHQLRRRERHPGVKREVGEVAAAEHLEKAQRRVAGILDVVAHGERHVTDVAGAEIEGARLTGRAEHAH